jgi:hypothetical protein
LIPIQKLVPAKLQAATDSKANIQNPIFKIISSSSPPVQKIKNQQSSIVNRQSSISSPPRTSASHLHHRNHASLGYRSPGPLRGRKTT